MRARRRGQVEATLLVTCALVASCSQELPPVRKGGWGASESPTPQPFATPLGCKPTSADEGTALQLADVMTQGDQVGVQFALDSLRLIRREAESALVCLLADERPLRAQQVMWLNEGGHWELIAHYRVRVVGDVAALALGPPPGQEASCGGETREARLACAAAWRTYRQARPSKG
jgi:hypothetical protein